MNKLLTAEPPYIPNRKSNTSIRHSINLSSHSMIKCKSSECVIVVKSICMKLLGIIEIRGENERLWQPILIRWNHTIVVIVILFLFLWSLCHFDLEPSQASLSKLNAISCRFYLALCWMSIWSFIQISTDKIDSLKIEMLFINIKHAR